MKIFKAALFINYSVLNSIAPTQINTYHIITCIFGFPFNEFRSSFEQIWIQQLPVKTAYRAAFSLVLLYVNTHSIYISFVFRCIIKETNTNFVLNSMYEFECRKQSLNRYVAGIKIAQKHNISFKTEAELILTFLCGLERKLYFASKMELKQELSLLSDLNVKSNNFCIKIRSQILCYKVSYEQNNRVTIIIIKIVKSPIKPKNP